LETFPNPGTDFLNLQLPETPAPLDVQVFDAPGRLALLAHGHRLECVMCAPLGRARL
jgi:hypothetical protein